jgi:hypothetical protein
VPAGRRRTVPGMEPNLYAELVDHTDPENPVTLRRSPVLVVVDDTPALRASSAGWTVPGENVMGGHQLTPGDVIVARDQNSDTRWLCEVTDAGGHPADRQYSLRRIVPWLGPRVWVNDDPRWG